MDYARIYEELVNSARHICHSKGREKHHIVPKCLGGADSKDNIVSLTPRQHFFAHELLVKMHPEHWGLSYAAMRMSGKNKSARSRAYQWVRAKAVEKISAASLGRKHSPEARERISKANKGRRHPPEIIAQIAAKKIGFKFSEESRAKLRAAKVGWKLSAETIEKVAAAQRGKPKPACIGNRSRTGMKNSQEMRRKVALANTGKKHRDSWRKNISLGQAKIPHEVVKAIRDIYAAGSVSQDSLSKQFGIGQSHVSRIIRRETYDWV